MLGNASLWVVPGHSPYWSLFATQVVSLLGPDLAVVLGLLVFELEGANARVILGTVLAIKIITYVIIASVAEALLRNLPRLQYWSCWISSELALRWHFPGSLKSGKYIC